MIMGIRRSMSVLLGALCALSLVLGSPPASADSRVVPDRAGERRDGFTVDSARFTVSRSHVRVTARYSPQMRRSELAFIQLDMRPRGNGTRGVYTASYNAYGRGDGRRWTLARRGVAGDIRCGWERRVDFRRDLVRMSLPAACFGRDQGFRSMDFSYTSYCEHDGIHNDRIRTRRPVRRG